VLGEFISSTQTPRYASN